MSVRILAIHISLLFVLLFSMGPARAAPVLSLTAPVPMTSVPPHMQSWCDADGTATFDQALQAPFADLASQQITFGYRHDACWFRAELHNRSEEAMPLWLQIDYALLDEVDVYLIDGGQREYWKMGDLQTFSSRPVRIRAYTVPISLAPAETKQLYLRVKTTSAMTVPVTISGRLGKMLATVGTPIAVAERQLLGTVRATAAVCRAP